MWRSKKFIIVALLVIVVLSGSIGGIALAQNEKGDDRPSKCRDGSIIDEVCNIYNAANPDAPVNCEALTDAFAEARDVMRPEGELKDRTFDPEARLNHLQEMIDQGLITQEEADEMLARMESMSGDGEGKRGLRGHRFNRSPACLPDSPPAE